MFVRKGLKRLPTMWHTGTHNRPSGTHIYITWSHAYTCSSEPRESQFQFLMGTFYVVPIWVYELISMSLWATVVNVCANPLTVWESQWMYEIIPMSAWANLIECMIHSQRVYDELIPMSVWAINSPNKCMSYSQWVYVWANPSEFMNQSQWEYVWANLNECTS